MRRHIKGLSSVVYGANNASVTIVGDLDAINTALDRLVYTPAVSQSGNYSSAANLQIITTDMAPELAGGQQTTRSTVSIAIAGPVYHLPVHRRPMQVTRWSSPRLTATQLRLAMWTRSRVSFRLRLPRPTARWRLASFDGLSSFVYSANNTSVTLTGDLDDVNA